MSLEQGLTQAILDDPDDDTHRLVYADWLEERGNPRGEFIRIQIERSRPELDEVKNTRLWVREQELLSAHEIEWVWPLRPWVREWRFARGFVDRVRVQAEFMTGPGKTVSHRTPVRHARFNEATDRIATLANLPEFSALRSLDLGYNLLGPRHVQQLVASPFLGKLEKLDLACNPLTDAGARTLATATYPRLSELHLYRTQLGAEGLAAILEAAEWAPCSTLILYSNLTMGSSAAACLARSPRSSGLVTLDLSCTGCRDVGVRALADSPRFGSLRSLKLEGNHLTDSAAEALASARSLGGLQELDLSGNDVGDTGARALANSTALKSLRRLTLSANGRLTDPEAERLLRERFGSGWRPKWIGGVYREE